MNLDSALRQPPYPHLDAAATKVNSFEKSSGKADDGSCVLHVTLAFHVLIVSETRCTLLGCPVNQRRKTIKNVNRETSVDIYSSSS